MNLIWGSARNDSDNPYFPQRLTVESTNNHIYFYADVDSDRGLALMREVRDADGTLRNEFVSRDLPDDFPRVPIWLHIYSPGGELFAGLAIADQLKHIQTPIYSVVEGYTASAATLISMSCTKRYIRSSAFMLIHQLSNAMWGKYDEFVDEMKLMNMAMEKLTGFYTEHSKLVPSQVRDFLSRDSWFSAEECLNYGLVDEII